MNATLTLDEWQILFHESMAALLRAQEAVKKQFGFLGLVKGLWRAVRVLKSINLRLKAFSEVPDGVLDESFVKARVPQIRKLLKSIEELIDAGQSYNLSNRSLTRAPFESIRAQGQQIADYLENLEMSIDPEVLAAIQLGHDQIENGEYEVMERLF